MKNTIAGLILILTVAVTAAEFSAVHDSKRGETVFTLPGEPGVYYLYRSTEAVTAASLPPGAECIRSRVAAGTAIEPYKVNGSGKFYYALLRGNDAGSGIQLVKAVGPIAETDVTPPGKITITGSYQDGFPVVSWSAVPLENPEGIKEFRVSRALGNAAAPEAFAVIGTVPNQRRAAMSWTDRALAQPAADYRVAAVDREGNGGAWSNVFHVVAAPDLAVTGSSLVAANPDLAVSGMYPVPGETVTFKAVVRNLGAKASAPTEVRIATGRDKTATLPLPEIAAGKSFVVSWPFRAEKPGEYQTEILIDPKKQGTDGDWSNNRLVLRHAVAARKVYFLWYGNVKQLPYANAGQCPVGDIPEWQRRGGIAGAGVGAKGEKDRLLSMYEERLKQGYDGVFIDEIHMGGPEAQTMIKTLPEFRKRNPHAFVALWTIGEDTVPEVAALVKSGVVDVLMLEIYLKPEEKFTAFDQAVANMRRHGIADKTVIGLVTHKEWDNWVGGAKQAEYLLRQMQYIRRIAPEMPGFAFWSDDAHPGVIEAVDAEYYKLFINCHQ